MTATLTLEKYNTDFCLKSVIDKLIYPIGKPVTTLSDTLNENEIWLEGAEVSKTTYAALYSIYGDTYGTSEDENNFVLPDFRGRAIWGSDDFGYLEAGLPDHTHTVTALYYQSGGKLEEGQGSPDYGKNISLTTSAASEYNAIYGSSDTVQPPAIKVRVKTRYI